MAKTKSYIGIKNAKSENTLELHFTDYIYDGFNWDTWESINLVQDTINKIKDANPDKIKVVINSLGGDVMVGLALYNYIKNHKAEKEVEIIGFAASIASVMAMCADKGKLKMAKNAFMIIHAAWSMAMGNADEIRAQAETLDKITNELADIYAQRAGKTAKHFTNLWKDGDHWMTGSEAMDEGLVDEIFNAEPVTAGVDVQAHNFKHIPAGLIAASAEKPGEDHKTFFQNLKAEFMAILDSFKAATKKGKEDKKFENVAGKNEVIDMVEEIFTPVLNEIDEAIKKFTPVKDEVKTEEKKEEKKEEVKAEETELEKLKAENTRLKAAAAAAKAAPVVEPAASGKTNVMSKVKARYAKAGEDDDENDD